MDTKKWYQIAVYFVALIVILLALALGTTMLLRLYYKF